MPVIMLIPVFNCPLARAEEAGYGHIPSTDCNVQRAAGGPSDPDTRSTPDEG